MSSQGLSNQGLREFSFEDEDEMIEQMTEERNRGRIDNRPSISDINTSLNYNKIIHKDEEEKVIKRIRKSEKEKKKPVFILNKYKRKLKYNLINSHKILFTK